MILNETILAKPVVEEVSREKLPEGVLCRLSYPICNIGQRNANNRVYEEAVWDKVEAEKDVKEKIENRALFGHAEHPEQTQSNLEKTSHVIFEMWRADGKEWQRFDVLDTPTGRIVDTLIRAGCQVGVSTRAEGDLEEAEDDQGTYHRVIPESYKYVTTDFTADPSTFGVIPHDVKRNIVSEVKKVLDNKEVNGSEKEFASCLLESMKCEGDNCQGCGCCQALKESKKYIMEGVWALPNTIAKAKKLSKLLEEPLCSAAAIHNLHNILGEDELWDEFHYIKNEPAIGDDVRPKVRKRIKQYLKDYAENPKDFKHKLDPEAEKILKSLVESKTVESLIKDGIIKVDTKVVYADKSFKVSEVDEAVSAITIMPDVEGREVRVEDDAIRIDGNPYVAVDKDGTVTIMPVSQPEPVPAGPPEEEVEAMEDAGPLPIEKELPERKVMGPEDVIKAGDVIEIRNLQDTETVVSASKVTEVGTMIGDDGVEFHKVKTEEGGDKWYEAEAYALVRHPLTPKEESVEEEKKPRGKRLQITFTTDREKAEVNKLVDQYKALSITKFDEETIVDGRDDIAMSELEGELEVLVTDYPGISVNVSEHKVEEGRIPVEGGVSDKLAAGNVLRDKDDNYYNIKSFDPITGITLEPFGGGVGTVTHLSWDKAKELGLVKISESKLDEDKYAVVVREHDDGWKVYITGAGKGKDRLLRTCEDKEEAEKFGEKFAGDAAIPYKGVVETKLDEKTWRIKFIDKEGHLDRVAIGAPSKEEAEEKLLTYSPEVDIKSTVEVEESIDETKDIKAMYRAAGFTPPKGKGEHTVAFHELAIDVAKGYVEEKGKEEALQIGYATAMKQLGPEKAVKKAHRRSESKVNEQEEEILDIDLGPLEKEIERRIGIPVKLTLSSKESRSGKTYWSCSSDDMIKHTGIFQAALKSAWIQSFSGGDISDEGVLWWTIVISFTTKDGGSNGVDIMRGAWYDTNTKEWTFKGVNESILDESIKVGDDVEVMDLEGNTTVVPASKVTDVDEALGADGEMHTVIQTEKGGDVDYSDENYQLVKIAITGESVSTTTKEIKNLIVKEASVRAERDKAVEFLEELTDSNQTLQEKTEKTKKEKALETKILVNKMSKILEEKDYELSAFRTKLEEKLKLIADLKNQLNEKNELATEVEKQLNEVKTNLSNDIKDLKESATSVEAKYQKDLKEMEDKHQNELSGTVKSLEEKIEKVKEETEGKVKKEVSEEVTHDFVCSYVKLKLSETGLKVDANSRALLEKCESLEEVDDLLEEIVDSSRRSALHSKSIMDIHIVERKVADPEVEEARRKVGNCFEGMMS